MDHTSCVMARPEAILEERVKLGDLEVAPMGLVCALISVDMVLYDIRVDTCEAARRTRRGKVRIQRKGGIGSRLWATESARRCRV